MDEQDKEYLRWKIRSMVISLVWLFLSALILFSVALAIIAAYNIFGW